MIKSFCQICACNNFFTYACSCAIVFVLHAGLVALARETILNATHVSHVAHERGVYMYMYMYLTRELYCTLCIKIPLK